MGYVYDEDGATVMDPDEEIRQAIADFFAAFSATGSAYGAVGALKGRPFPRRAFGGAWAGEIHWGRLTHGRALDILANPAYAGAYVYGRFRSQRTLSPDGMVATRTTLLAREQWPVVIQGHHPGYISWETYLANEARLAANHTRAGARPPREGVALLQGIVICGSCGRPMSTNRPAGNPTYECCHSRADHTESPGCRSVMAELVDAAVAERLLEVVSPEQIAIALAAADELADRRARGTRAAELAVERARYEAARAERAFHQCDPDNRLVARSLESRWEDKLGVLAAAEAALVDAAATLHPLPPREALEDLAQELPRLWGADSTSPKDRKRIIRSLIADVTLTSQPASRAVRVGIRWHTGAAEELTVTRKARITERRCTPPEVVQIVRELGPGMDNKALAKHLAGRGFLTGAGQPFDADAVGSIRHYYGIGSPELLNPGEVTVREVASRLGVGQGAVIHWIDTGRLPARRGHSNRWCIPFSPEIEATCREWVAASPHIHRDIDPSPPDPEELTIAAVAERLGVSTHVVYYWAGHGYIPVRRGPAGRRYISFSAEVEARCRRRISDSYRLPPECKSKAMEIWKGAAV